MIKAFHYINFIVLFLFLVGICVLEDYLVSNSLVQVQNQLFEIENAITDRQSLLSSDIVILVDNLEYNWAEDESGLCLLVNHKSMQEIGVEIAKLKACIANDNVEDFYASLNQIELCCHEYLHFMGASPHNIL